MNIKVEIKSGKSHELKGVDGTIEEVLKVMNRTKFIRFGPIIINCDEIESITKTS